MSGELSRGQMSNLLAGRLQHVGGEVVTRSILNCTVMRLMTGVTTHVDVMTVGGHRVTVAVDAYRPSLLGGLRPFQLSLSVARTELQDSVPPIHFFYVEHGHADRLRCRPLSQ